MTAPPPAGQPSSLQSDDDTGPVCIMAFNASDPSGAAGMAADISAISSVGGHPLPVLSGVYMRDTAQTLDFSALDAELLAEQARVVLEDLSVQVFKVGFLGSPENVSVVAEILSDYADVPAVAFMPDLSWWQDDLIDSYQDALAELLLPQTSVLVGNHSTLWRWLLPDWSHQKAPSARDLAAAAAALGTPYTLVTGIPLPEQFVDNVLASPQAVLGSAKFELFEAIFTGAGETLSATLAALLAAGHDLGEATSEALSYLDGCLANGFRPGMGHVLPDRMFWAQPEDDDDNEPEPDPSDTSGFEIPPHDTKH